MSLVNGKGVELDRDRCDDEVGKRVCRCGRMKRKRVVVEDLVLTLCNPVEDGYWYL
jgi:hypothetical protein